MILQLGRGADVQQHRINSAGLAIEKAVINDDRGIPYLERVTWNISYQLRNPDTDPKSLDSLINQIQFMYSQEYEEVSLRHDDGTATAHIILGAIGKVRTIKPPSYARWQNGEYVSYRTGNVVIEGLVPIGDLTNRVTELSERIEFSGGGPEYAFLQPNTGLPIKQQTRTNTPFRATQSGRITYYGGYGAIPGPIWPGALVGAPVVSLEPSKRLGTVRYDFPKTYSYQFASATALT